ncbi:thiamine-phosphate pyrophosphorylase [Chitinophaga sp. W2I13]|uniref:thiamine phosphate synthase n=1 Tax=Chitinophaga sp. W2I13 TaxID=3373923 RepID=UPI003D24E8C5
MIWIITSPERIHEEVDILAALLTAGVERVLLRKPGWSAGQYAALLDKLPPECYNRVLIRDHGALAARYSLAGVHWSREGIQRFLSDAATSNEKTAPGAGETEPLTSYLAPENFKENSTGIHSPEGITLTDKRFQTLLLSPVFNSISKPGYHGRVQGMLPDKNNRRVLALGGVDHSNIHLLKTWQFDGAALLGAIWKIPAQAVEHYCRIQQLWNKSDLT